MGRIWQLQEAKSKFSQLVNEAQKEGPQIITRHGDEVAVLLSYAEYTRLREPQSSLVEFLRASPLAGADLDLARDQSPARADLEL